VIRTLLLRIPRRGKQSLAVAADLLMGLLAVILAVDLRLEGFVSISAVHLWPSLACGLLAPPIFTALGLYRAIFRYSGLQALFTLNKALAAYALAYATLFTVQGVEGVPRALGLIQPMIFAFLVIGSRLFLRYWLGGIGLKLSSSQARPVLIYGAGSAGRQLANSIYQSSELRAVGFVDDDDRLHGHVLNGLPIHAPKDLPALVSRTGVHEIYLALPSASRHRRNEILQELKGFHLKVMTLPGLMDLASGKVSVSDLKELEIEDLLGREPVPPNPLLLAKSVTGKVVMVTGAGGSIGSELCRQIVRANPATLLLVDSSEFALYQIERDLSNLMEGKGPEGTQQDGATRPVKVIALLGNVLDERRLGLIMRTWRPHTVYHAAAYKHVPLVEHNPAEGIRNNVWGTLVLARLALSTGVRSFVLVSTDKAVRPTNIMGASKRVAEMGLQALAQQASEQGRRTCFSMVRFGNVLGSSGSVVPLFRSQIAAGGPITLTDERVTRYFMTIPEAAQLVIQAGAMAVGGDVFVLDMGESVRILDLARRMIELSGLTVRDVANPGGDIAIEVTGLRPGEKLFEELLIGDNPSPTQNPRIMRAHERFLPQPEFESLLLELEAALAGNEVERIRSVMAQLVHGYVPGQGVVDHVSQSKSWAA
jgi:FlaA1/EpsC-like NDP-sugar epimerase